MAKDNNGPLSIVNEMRQFDKKNRDFYDSLDEQDQRKFSPYLMIRWGSNVSGSPDLQEYYLLSTNRRFNRNFMGIPAQHKKLQWLLATTVSPDLGSVRHNWLAAPKRQGNAMSRQLEELFPDILPQELDVLAQITTQEEIDEYIQQLGQR
jgi:hypothetical protein